MLYNTEKILHSNRITKEDILEKVSEYTIFSKYIGNIKIGAVYNSPLREDKNPSFGIFVSNRDKALLYKDMANGDCGDVFKFVKKLFNYSKYSEVYNRIYEDMNLSFASKMMYTKKEYKIKETKISVTRKKMSKDDFDFWLKFGITKETLKLYNVDSISSYFANGIIKAKYTKEEPMYSYKVFNKFKIYKPLSKKLDKWRGNLSSFDIQGFEQLPETADLLIITKSLKDVMVLYEMGYNAISPPSESTIIPEIIIKNLKSRFKKIIMFYDRDAAGVIFTRKMVKLYGFDFIFINKKYKTKDISDLVKKLGYAKALTIFDEMIN